MCSLRAPWALLVIPLLAACGTDAVPCEGSCPDVSGAYVLETQTVTGVCAFTPYVAQPTFTLSQSADGSVSTTVLDPVNGAPETVTGTLYQPADGGALADFSMVTRTVRLAGPDRPDLLELRVVFTGSVAASQGGRLLAGTLSTTGTTAAGEPDPTGGCTMSVNLTARR